MVITYHLPSAWLESFQNGYKGGVGKFSKNIWGLPIDVGVKI